MPTIATHVVEWSVLDRSLRVRPFADFLETNIRIFFDGTPRDYAPLGFFDSPEAAAEFLSHRSTWGGSGLN